MKNLVLIHGAWHKSSCWDTLNSHLSDIANIYTPNLVEQADYRDICLSTYLKILTNLLSQIDGEVLLITHSFGGFIAREIANLMPQKIKQIIYINGLIPIRGESLFSLTQNFHYQHLNPYFIIDNDHQEVIIQPLEKIHEYMYQTMQIADLNVNHFRSEPFAPLSETFSGKNFHIPEQAIISQHDLSIHVLDQIFMCKRENIPYKTINSDHCPFQSNSIELSKIIKECISNV